MSLKDKIKKKAAETRAKISYGCPIMIGFSGVRKPECKHFKLHRSYKTEYCSRPEHVKRQAQLQGGMGITTGCENCSLNGGAGVQYG